MPKVSLRRRLIDGAYAYARRLQAWRTRERDRRDREEEEEIIGGLGVGNKDDEDVVSDLDSSMDVSDISSVASVSSSSASESNNFDSEDEETQRFHDHYLAIRERIQQLESARTLKPKTKVHKKSQLHLVLVLYRRDDPHRFRRNLRVAPDTFDGIVHRIESHPVFGGEEEGGHRQLPVDRQLAITLFRFGHFGNRHTGSTHDSTAFAQSRTCKDHAQLIGPNEWIWADSAYPVESWCVTPFKKPANRLPENKTFNYWVSHVRIRSEHAVGFLKGRFQSLRGLRQQIKNEKDHLRALEWIRACLVLHTLIHIIESEGGSLDQEWVEELIRDGESDVEEDREEEAPRRRGQGGRETAGNRKRRKLKEDLFASGATHR
ncbi:unnamed protein product [Mycena citricolor]|uniref:DDE Tnp4 domain-containing protein n=1 Tax=Mycena citricolor TaxID=2018698 RepID=A0AAD2HFV3_9AGAR|nr:unnamed protein product [Mycena citricolor]